MVRSWDLHGFTRSVWASQDNDDNNFDDDDDDGDKNNIDIFLKSYKNLRLYD